MRRLSFAVLIALLTNPAWTRAGDDDPLADLDARTAALFEHAYNLDQEEALAGARALVAMYPQESGAHRALAGILWLDVLFRRGAVTVDHYMGGVTRSKLSLPKPPDALDAEFKREVGQAVELANATLRTAPTNVRARYDLGAAYGLLASYQASVEGSTTSAFLTARRAFDAQEDVLKRDPQMTEAGVVVGTYRYVVAGLALPSRMFAYMMGFGGDKARGIALVETAASRPTTHVEATLALVLIYSREGRHADALRLLRGLSTQFPRNRIFVLEQGSAALRAGRQAEGDALLTRGLDMFEHDPRRKIPGERALWLYKRGLARMGLNRVTDSAADLQAALESGPEEWVRGRIRLALGKLEDIRGQRPQAVASYESARSICGAAKDPLCVAEASRWIKARYSQIGRP